ncbi:unnamed protein product [Oreochromis niloticus]|nr:unnamed protein product [Mustela putorius furo]
MAPLTSTSSCESCINLSQKMIELEQRISTLYQIQGAERELDTILLGKAQTTATSAELADTVHHPAAVSQDPANSQPRLSTCVAGVSATDENCWFQLRARPKALVSSTSLQPAPWTVVETRGGCRGARRIHLSHPHPSGVVVLENKFSVLDPVDFPLLAASPRHSTVSLRSAPSPPLHRRSRGGQPDAVVQTRRGELCFTTAPWRRGPMARLPGSHSRGPAGASPFEHPWCRAAGVSYGATVVDIVDRIPNILASHPQANRLIIHIGTNDIPKQQSELLKLDFLQLFSLLAVSSSMFVVTQSPDVSVMEGETVSITCCWTRTFERFRVAWLKNQTIIKRETNANQSPESLKKEAKTCSSLNISNIRTEDSGTYICKVTVKIPSLTVSKGNGTIIIVREKTMINNGNNNNHTDSSK